MKPEDTKPAKSDEDILENLERLVASLPKDKFHAAAAKNLVDHLRDNPLSSMYDPSDDESEQPIHMITKVMFLKKHPKRYPCFCFIQYDSRQEENFRKGLRHALMEERTKNSNGDECMFRPSVSLMKSLGSTDSSAGKMFVRYAHFSKYNLRSPFEITTKYPGRMNNYEVDQCNRRYHIKKFTTCSAN